MQSIPQENLKNNRINIFFGDIGLCYIIVKFNKFRFFLGGFKMFFYIQKTHIYKKKKKKKKDIELGDNFIRNFFVVCNTCLYLFFLCACCYFGKACKQVFASGSWL